MHILIATHESIYRIKNKPSKYQQHSIK